MRLTRARAAAAIGIAVALLLAACAVPRAPLGDPLVRVDPAAGYRVATFAGSRRQDDLLFMVAFSGGGMRASAMAYGVLEQLAADRVGHDGVRPRLLDEVDLVSAVSGAAVTAAYYVVHGDRLFTDFERRFLKRDVEGALRRRLLLDPGNWLRLMSEEYSRGDLYARWFDRKLFHGARFADLAREGSRPFLVLNATDLGVESRVEFTQDAFDPVCVDLDRYPVARAVAASSAVPVFTTPITILNRAGGCGYAPPDWVGEALASEPRNSRLWAQAFAQLTYQDAASYRYLHLVDGALSDNLGVRTALDAITAAGDPGTLLHRLGVGRPRKIVLLTVNASGFQSERLAASRQPPPISEMIRMLGTVPVDRYSVESKSLLREALARWSAVLETEGRAGDLHHIEVELDAMREQPRYARLLGLPTTFSLPGPDVDDLRCAARLLLTGNPEYRRLVLDLGGVEPGPGDCR
jgi:NTE family protein